MKNNMFLIIVFSVFVSLSPAQATIIKVFEINSTFDTTTIGNLTNYSLHYNMDNKVQLGYFNYNSLELVQPGLGRSTVINMLQRTYNPSSYDLLHFADVRESWDQYVQNKIRLGAFYYNDSKYAGGDVKILEIPDLSAYIIKDLYVDNVTNIDGATPYTDTHIMVDADPVPEPVPEPSTFILLAIGVIGISFLRREREGKKKDVCV